MNHYYIIYKPYLVLSQFTSQDGKQTLGNIFNVPKDVYPVGRLDNDSEGLLILTNDTSLNHRLLDPKFKHEREYWVQVDGQVTPAAIKQLEQGVTITVDGKKHLTQPCKVKVFNTLPSVPERNPPVRFRKHIPTSWISIVLTEGKNRQVRKMTAAVGHPTLRLIRHRIGSITLPAMTPGFIQQFKKEELYTALFGSVNK